MNLTFKTYRSGEYVVVECKGMIRIPDSQTQIKVEMSTHYLATQCMDTGSLYAACRAMASSIYAKSVDDIRRATLAAMERVLREMVPPSLARGPGRALEGTLTHTEEAGWQLALVGVSPDGDADQGASATIANEKE